MQFTPEFLYMFSYALVIIMKIVCFIISYKIVKLGYNLVQAGVKGEFKFSSNFLGFKADLVSLSPGLLFVLLGVLFMMVAIYVNKTITYKSGYTPPVATYPPPVKNDSAVVPNVNDYQEQFHDSSKSKKP